MLISDYYAALGQQDRLFQPVPAEKVPNLADVAEFAKEPPTRPGLQLPAQRHRLQHRAMNADEAATWDVFAGAHKGKVALPDISVTAGQLMISGVAASYGSGPYDVDAAYRKLAEWKPGVLQFYSSSTEVTNLLTQGEIVAADTLNGFATNLIADGEKSPGCRRPPAATWPPTAR